MPAATATASTSQPVLQTIASPRRGARLGANRRNSTPRPATTATAAAGAKASSTLSRSRRRQRRLRTGRAYRGRESGDVVGAVVTPAVDEEGGRAGHGAE